MAKRGKGRPTKYSKKLIKEMIEFFTKGYEDYLEHDFSETETVQTVQLKDSPKTNGKQRVTKKSKKIVRLPTVFGFAISIGVSTRVLADWAKKYPDFLLALETCKEMTAEIAVQGSSNGTIQPNIARLIIVNSSTWNERQEVDHKSSDGSMTPTAPKEASEENVRSLLDLAETLTRGIDD